MTPNEFQFNCLKTESEGYRTNLDSKTFRVMHGLIGLSTEANEMLDNLKAHLYYNKPFDKLNIKEELGDALWFIAQICNSFEWEMEDLFKINVAKLRKRYPEKFNPDLAIYRDTDAERATMEQADKQASSEACEDRS